MDILFRIAIILLPFENLFFAPSSGWATVTPIILFLYVIFNLKYLKIIFLKYKKIMIFYLLLFLLTPISYIFHGINLNAFLDTIITLFLGLCILISFEIFFIQKKNDTKKICKYLVYSYTISILFGILQYVAIKFNINILQSFFDFISKRNYMNTYRVQFSFTEPSFIGMHLFGILLPVYFCTKNKKILNILIMFIIFSLVFNSSVRFILDTLIVIMIILGLYLIKTKKIEILIISIVAILIGFTFLYNHNDRIHRIVSNGIYSDNSLAARYFRIEASVYGYSIKPLNLITGYGMGNASKPLKIGYNNALKNYKNNYYGEINTLKQENYNNPSATFCFYTRIISEYGIFIFIIFCVYIKQIYKNSNFKYKLELLLITAYLYLQFDSYAFYTLWILIFILKNYKKERIINDEET